MWKLIGLILGGGGIPREAARYDCYRRPASIDEIGDRIGCLFLFLFAGIFAAGIAIMCAIVWWVF